MKSNNVFTIGQCFSIRSVVLLLLCSCSVAPVSVTNCRVFIGPRGEIVARAVLINHSNLLVRQVNVQMSAEDPNGSYNPIEYEFINVRLGASKSVETETDIEYAKRRGLVFSLQQHLAEITSCDVQSIDFANGSHWLASSPL